ncbi:anion transporter [Ideonella sp. A 288]|uniref:anion transporter n=1 Tax=Ideonella sp. A 288 TaxID=1962181 RepID=UPI0018FEC8D5|nr:anion transporter [Ideonella sp. A 288]
MIDPQWLNWAVLAVFGVVYLGMVMGSLPWLHLDRTGVALLGAIAVIGLGAMTPEQAAQSVHLPTILLLFAFMVISAQMRLGGFYGAVTRRIAALPLSAPALMGVVIAVTAALSAVFSNDIVCLAVAPVLAEACLRRQLDPVPYLLALACASNIGSAATLIGNPQNMLIGEVLKLSFGDYLRLALPPVLAGLLVLWALLGWSVRGGRADAREAATPSADKPAPAGEPDQPFDLWQTAKGLAVALVLMGVFLFTDWPRDVAALTGAGLLLLSQRFHSSRVMGLIDWELLVLFMGLFVVNAALQHTGLTQQAVQWLASQGVALGNAAHLFGATLLLSNLVSNVPAVMLLLPVASGAHHGATLALASTLAGNLLIVGSIANLIVVDAARRAGIDIDWRRHARIGVPVTLLSLAIAVGWLALRA